MHDSRGFTLIELMIVVAIISILASIAIPNFMMMQMRAKRAELPVNINTLRLSELAYHSEWDEYTSAPLTPLTMPGASMTTFTGGGYAQFTMLGWYPDGLVRGQYQVQATGGVTFQTDDFTATAACDVDADTGFVEYSSNRAEKAEMLTANNVY
ncbi:MAG: prepilin-type N-terminal cleavage/methylation domain-containing protein [Deltaproteobacteria bacterium]|nr:prepilin-type N-terminal cleavage/methylation domain-containing protein [Deltaproteobacteria bacterium]